MPSNQSHVVLHRLDHTARHTSAAKVRLPWTKSRRTTIRKAKSNDLTPEQRKQLKEAREKKKQDLRDALVEARDVIYTAAEDMKTLFGGHDVNYYFRLILQNAIHIKKPARKLTLWNGFVSKELKAMNAAISDDAEEEPHRVNNAVIKELSALIRLEAMSAEEQEAAAADELAVLIERRKNRVEGVHNVALHAFNDTRANIASVTRQLKELKGRTDNDFLLIATRSKVDDYNPPYVFHTNERIQHYVETVTKMPLPDFAAKLESHIISGVDGVFRNAREETIELKRKVKDVIFAHLQEACTRTTIPKMFYVNFDEHITLKFGVIIENWPLKRFAAPGSLSRVELEVLLKAWENKTTTFRQLTDEEWSDWRDAYRDGRVEDLLPTPPTSTSQPEAAAAAPSSPAAAPVSGSSSSDPVPAPTAPAATLLAPVTIAAATVATAPSPTFTAPAALSTITFLNAVTNADGTGFVVPKRARKERSDKNTTKGKKRGTKDMTSHDAPPRKRARKGTAIENVAPVA